MTYLRAAMWPLEHLRLYCSMLLVILEMLGRVCMTIQLKEAINSWSAVLFCSCCRGVEVALLGQCQQSVHCSTRYQQGWLVED